MDDPVLLARIQFAFTISFHYLFSQLTMGLALAIALLKTLALWKHDERFNQAARFWAKIFALTFVIGVVTGIPMEFQFGTNWARFSAFAGGVIAQTLAMEGAFAFFLESAVLGLFLYGERRIGPFWHWLSSVFLFLGTWASAYFIIATNAWMQSPVGYALTEGKANLTDQMALLSNPWIWSQLLHNQCGSVTTAAFVIAGLGAFYLLAQQHLEYGRLFVKLGVLMGVIASLLQLYPTGDWEGRNVALQQPVKLAAMEGLFRTEKGAGIAILGQPDVKRQTLDNPLIVPRILSFLTYQSWGAEIKGLDAYPKEVWPDNIPLLYYSYHIMVGLGTMFIAIMGLATLLLWRGALYRSRAMLWSLMLSIPFPFIANTAGWVTTELGRQPWLVHGIYRTASGISPNISSGSIWFTLLGFAGMYALLGMLYLVLILKEVAHGPDTQAAGPESAYSVSS